MLVFIKVQQPHSTVKPIPSRWLQAERDGHISYVTTRESVGFLISDKTPNALEILKRVTALYRTRTAEMSCESPIEVE